MEGWDVVPKAVAGARRRGRRHNFLAVFGHTNVDHIARVPAFPPMNQSIQITRFETLWGGTAANIAAVAARQGVPVALASLVGGNFPDQFHEHLRGLGVDLTELRRIDDAPTPECYIFSDGEDNQVAFVIQGPMDHAHRQGVQTRALRSSERVHLATGNPRYHLAVAREARRMRLPVSFDPGQELHYRWSPRPFRSMLRLTDMLFLSEAEMRCTLHFTGASRVEELLDEVPAIVITLGRGGSRMLRRDRPEVRAPVVRARGVEDTTGAGDAFRGGFYSGMWRGLSDEECMRIGAATASFVVETRGPQTNMPTYEQAAGRAAGASKTRGRGCTKAPVRRARTRRPRRAARR